MNALPDFFAGLDEPLDEIDLPWFVEPKDKDPKDEFARQSRFVSLMRQRAPGAEVTAIPNANTGTDWQRVRRKNEGARAGALDLFVTWAPAGQGDRGIAFLEFKDGQKMPSRVQREQLNSHYRKGHLCGVFRTPERAMAWLRDNGCPVRERAL